MVNRWECRLLQKRPSSAAKTAKRTSSEEIQRRNTSIGQKDLCKVRITVAQTVATSLVSVKRIGEGFHSHTIEESFIAKRPKSLLNIYSKGRTNDIMPQHKSITQCPVLGQRKDHHAWSHWAL